MSSEMYPKEQIERIHRLMEDMAKHNQTIGLASDYLMDFKLNFIGQEKSFAGMVITPSDDSKNAILNIPYQILNANGSQSKEAVRWMAQQVLKILKTDYAVAISHNPANQLWWIAVVNSSSKVQIQSFDLQSQMTKTNVMDILLSIVEEFVFQ